MRSELVVDVQPKEISIALLEDGRLMSLQKEARNIKFAVGDIYYGRIKKLMPGLNAAFVDIGSEKDAFSDEENRMILTAIRGHRRLREGAEVLEKLLYTSDKASRMCFACPAEGECDWSTEKKNMELKI